MKYVILKTSQNVGGQTFSRFLLHLLNTVIFFCVSSTVLAQHQTLYSQYMFNGLAINPAYTGSHGALSATAWGRQQWVGLKGAPSTQTISLHTPFRVSPAAVGLIVSRDQIGVNRQVSTIGTYAYRLPLAKGTLAMGIQAGATQSTLSLTDLNVVSGDERVDPTFQQTTTSRLQPVIGTGLYYYTKYAYLGLSAPQLISASLLTDSNNEPAIQSVQPYFLSGGYVFQLSPSVKFKPNFLVRAAENTPTSVDINANMLFQEILWLGVGYRAQEAITGLVQLKVNKNISVGYAYDFTTSDLQPVQSGSHEIMINYTVNISKRSILSPQYF